jgi:gliding motility-associated-like protein
VGPAPYYDFLYWTLKNNPFIPDSTATSITAQFFTTDTVIAWLKPQEYVFYAPNSFTPNGDGINDVFIPVSNVVDLLSYEFDVFDRWGAVIYSTRNPNAAWDGTAGGTPLPNGVYVFRAYAVDAVKKDRHELFGHVTLFR